MIALVGDTEIAYDDVGSGLPYAVPLSSSMRSVVPGARGPFIVVYAFFCARLTPMSRRRP